MFLVVHQRGLEGGQIADFATVWEHRRLDRDLVEWEFLGEGGSPVLPNSIDMIEIENDGQVTGARGKL
ncbi:MAG: hypothetical protein AAGA96_14620 [Verrucomicrobiota bacterium]